MDNLHIRAPRRSSRWIPHHGAQPLGSKMGDVIQMIRKPHEIVERWMELVHERELGKILALYDQNAILIPTFSDSIQNTPEKIGEYFKKLLCRKNLKLTLHPKTIRTQQLNALLFVVSGIYQWKFNVEDELITYEARFTFVIDITKTSPIIHHHSSQIPRMI